jgi:hypothetical protein
MPKRNEDYDGICFEGAEAIAISRNHKNLLIDCSDFDEPMWIPVKCIHDDSEVYRWRDKGTLIVQQWWAERNGLT